VVSEAIGAYRSSLARIAERSVSLRLLLASAAVAAFVGAAVAGLGVAFVARSAHFTYFSAADLNLQAARNFNINASHVRLVGRDGNFEFEHQTSVPVSDINAYDVGTGRRTPVQIGVVDGQDVVALRVAGSAGQKHDLQQWTSGGKIVAAVDAKGRLHLGSVALSTEVVSGVPYLVARLPSGKVYDIALTGRPTETGRSGHAER
jgi:hypothetical protein